MQSAAAQCVLYHESTDFKFSDNGWQFENGTFYAVTGLTGDPGSYSVAVQDAAAFKCWQEEGWSPWAADDWACGQYE